MPARIPGENECAKYLSGAELACRLDLNPEHLGVSAKLIAYHRKSELVKSHKVL